MATLCESGLVNGFIIFIGILTLFCVFIKRKYSYWERKGFKTLPNFNYFCGHFKETLTQKEFAGELVTRLYNSTTEPFIGIYSILRPILLVRDPDLIRSILIKDFSYFTDRGVHCNVDFDPLSGNLFGLPGQKWKNLRSKLSPAFSSGKLKAMFGTLLDCGSTLQNYLETFANDDIKLLDVRDVAARYTTNIIASVGFGIQVDTLTDPTNDFRVCGSQIVELSIGSAIRWFLFFNAPKLMSLFRIKIVNSKVDHFLRSITKENLRYREENNVSRKDIFQLLIQLRNTGTVQLDDEWETVIKGDDNQKTLSEDEIAAQTFIFFSAGFETSSTTLSFCLYELCKNPEIQQRVHNEIDKVLEEHGGKITFESVADMKYLESCFDETLRLYPTLTVLNRKCVEDYQIPGTDKIIEKGTQTFLPVMALQRDAKYYEDPEQFNPNRFVDGSPRRINDVNPPYLPFGDGPRNCIAMRLGKLQTKVGLIMMLQKFRFELGDQHKNSEMKFDPKSLPIAPLGGIHLRVFTR